MPWARSLRLDHSGQPGADLEAATRHYKSQGRAVQDHLLLGLVKRELPFGEHPRRSKRSRYKIGDPFLRYWYRFVDPNRSLLEARQLDVQTRTAWLAHLSEIWEDVVRASIPNVLIDGTRWQPAQAWWGGARVSQCAGRVAGLRSNDR
jgi:hypothetical protein